MTNFACFGLGWLWPSCGCGGWGSGWGGGWGLGWGGGWGSGGWPTWYNQNGGFNSIGRF